jgi:16S rRNA (guanine527-N7)-methyltransferase
MKLSTGERSAFAELISAPSTILAKLDRYAELLIECGQKFNLVASSTLPHIWSRHFLDSAQLMKLMPQATHAPHDTRENPVLVDLGSGAGFLGLVLEIMGIPNIHLIESIGKKADFLRAVIDDLSLNATVHQCRIESMRGLKADIITARALVPLTELVALAAPLMKANALCLFLKGRNVDAELTVAQKCWMFDHTKVQSLSNPDGSVLVIRNLKKHAKRRLKFSGKS